MNTLLFQLRLLHSYFASGIFEYCTVEADAKTQDFIRRYQCISNLRQGVFRLQLTERDAVTEFLTYLTTQLDGDPLRFYLCADPAWFSAVTDLPMNWVGQIALSSQEVIADAAGKALMMQPRLAARSVQKNTVIAVVSIFVEDILKAAQQPVCYAIHFTARSLYWNYLVATRSLQTLKKFSVKNKAGMVFQAPVPAQFPNGEAALSFSSAPMQFPLEQIPAISFDLMDSLPMHDVAATGETRYVERCLIQGLPTPQAGQFSLREIEGKQCVFSDMYVYV